MKKENEFNHSHPYIKGFNGAWDDAPNLKKENRK